MNKLFLALSIFACLNFAACKQKESTTNTEAPVDAVLKSADSNADSSIKAQPQNNGQPIPDTAIMAVKKVR